MVNLKKPDRKRKIRRDRHVGQHRTVRFRRYENLPACIPLDNSAIDPGPEQLSYVDLELTYKEAKKAWDARDPWFDSLRKSQLEYNRRKSAELEEKDRKFAELLRLRDQGYAIKWDDMPVWPFKFNTIRRNKMFNEDEVNFIEETAKKDLKALQIKIEQLVNEMARMGKNLSDLKVVESKLTSILRAIADDREDDRCGGNC